MFTKFEYIKLPFGLIYMTYMCPIYYYNKSKNYVVVNNYHEYQKLLGPIYKKMT